MQNECMKVLQNRCMGDGSPAKWVYGSLEAVQNEYVWHMEAVENECMGVQCRMSVWEHGSSAK